MVPWYPDELNQVGDQGINFGLPRDCAAPVFGSSRSRLGPSEVVDTGEEDEVGELGVDKHTPINSYDPSCGLGYLDWVTQCASEIYPIVGISYVGHKLQLLALLTFLEGERCNNKMVANLSSGTEGMREINNLECLVNYDARGLSSSHGNRKGRESSVV